jgi:hypothetical protein
MVGIDVALTEFPERTDQGTQVQRELDSVLVLQVCATRVPLGVQVVVRLENLSAGHSWPSGAAQDRRAWVELVASRAGATIYSSGVIANGVAVSTVRDSELWWFGDEIVDDTGKTVHMFWEAADYRSNLLPAMTAVSPADPVYVNTHRDRVYQIPGVPDQIEARVHVRPIDFDIIDDLVASGDLDASIRGAIPTFTLRSSSVVWQPSEGTECVPDL